jgi:outer membrane immunogenic protein
MDNVLFYGTGGLAYGNVKASYSNSYYDYYDNSWSDSETKWGWAAGAGVEYALTKNITMKAEYLYVDLGTASFSGGDYLENATVDVDAAFHTAKVGLNYKF